MNNGYSSPTGSAATSGGGIVLTPLNVVSAVFGSNNLELDKLVQYDADFVSGSTSVAVISVLKSGMDQLNLNDLVGINISGSAGGAMGTHGNGGYINAARGCKIVRRLAAVSSSTRVNLVFIGTGSNGSGTNAHVKAAALDALNSTTCVLSWPQTDDFAAGGALGSVVGQAVWGLENSPFIPEIDIKIDSIAVTAITKKLKAKWTPELGQDLNAYHNLDAEVELTQILSEQIALEIDREILEDLLLGATTKRYWSRAPGRFVDRVSGGEVGASTVTPDFTGNVSEWYETLIETINDVSAVIHRKTLRGGANFVVCGPEVANILEFTAGFRANVSVDSDKGTAGAVKVGSLSKKWDIFVDPYFLRNVVLVGRRGSSFLESGYVYAPYVPLQTTPTIFGVEDFVPRKGVMTRYAKKMVRPDLYGLVVISDMNIG